MSKPPFRSRLLSDKEYYEGKRAKHYQEVDESLRWPNNPERADSVRRELTGFKAGVGRAMADQRDREATELKQLLQDYVSHRGVKGKTKR